MRGTESTITANLRNSPMGSTSCSRRCRSRPALSLSQTARCRAVVAQAMHEGIHPQQQQIDKRQNGASDDQLLCQEAGERKVTPECTHNDGGDCDPNGNAQRGEPSQRWHPLLMLPVQWSQEDGDDDSGQE